MRPLCIIAAALCGMVLRLGHSADARLIHQDYRHITRRLLADCAGKPLPTRQLPAFATWSCDASKCTAACTNQMMKAVPLKTYDCDQTTGLWPEEQIKNDKDLEALQCVAACSAKPNSQFLQSSGGATWSCTDGNAVCSAECPKGTTSNKPLESLKFSCKAGVTLDDQIKDSKDIQELVCNPVCDPPSSDALKDSNGGTWVCGDKSTCVASCPNGTAPQTARNWAITCSKNGWSNFNTAANLKCVPACSAPPAVDLTNNNAYWSCSERNTQCTAACPGNTSQNWKDQVVFDCRAGNTWPQEANADALSGFKCLLGKGKSAGAPVGAIVGGVIGSLGGLCCLAGILWFFAVRRGRFESKGAKDTYLGGGATNIGFTVAPSGAYAIGKDPALVKRQHDRLRQAMEGFSLKLDACALPAFWQAVLAHAPGLEAIVDDHDRLSGLLIRHNVWCWLDRNLWSNKDALLSCPPFDENQQLLAPDTALGNYTKHAEVQQQIHKFAKQMAQDLELPPEEKASYLQSLEAVVKHALHLKLALKVVDASSSVWVTQIDTTSTTPQLQPLNGASQTVARTLSAKHTARQIQSTVVALCLAPGSGRASRASGFEQEQVVVVQPYGINH